MLLFHDRTTLAATIHRSRDLCPDSNHKTCGQGLPDNFCCPTDTVCLALAANTTAICCPKGQSCLKIQPFTCNIQAQNVTAHPDSPALTTALGADLPTCGRTIAGSATCCPFGFQCLSSAGVRACVMAEDQSVYSTLLSQTEGIVATVTGTTAATQATASTATTPTAASTTVAAATSTSTASPAISIDTKAAESSRGGLVAGSVIAFLVLMMGLGIVAWANRGRILDYFRGKSALRSWPRRRHAPPRSYNIPRTDSTKVPQSRGGKWSQHLGGYPKLDQVSFYAELDGTKAYQSTGQASGSCDALSPVELPAFPLSFSLWSQQQHNRRSIRDSNATIPLPPGASFVPLYRFPPIKRPGRPNDQDNFF